jgi:CDP-diacylglycerol--glycerol-3-phosphate 3-phosphatidyltransferase
VPQARDLLDEDDAMRSVPSVYMLKPAFQRMLLPIVDALARVPVRANTVTLLGGVVSLATGVVIATTGAVGDVRVMLVVPIAILIRMALNAIDGLLATRHATPTRLGGMLNELVDVLSDSVVLGAFAFVFFDDDGSSASVALVVTGMALAAASEVAGLASSSSGASRRYDGPMGKSDRGLVISILCVGLALGAPTGSVTVAFAIMDALLVVTIVQRVRHACLEVAV